MKWRSKRRKKDFNINYKVLLILLLTIFTILVFLFIASKFFNIKSIEVQSEKIGCSDNDQIKASVNVLGSNLFLFNSAKIEENLKNKFICIKSSTISIIIPDKIKIKVFGREPAAILINLKKDATSSGEASSSADFNFDRNEGDNFIIDSEGVIYSNNSDQVSAPHVYINGYNLVIGQKINDELIKKILKIIEKVKIFNIGMKEAKMYSDKTLLVNGMPRIIFGLGRDIDIQIASLQLILNKAKIDNESLEFVDLRFDKPIVRIAPKKK